ncbi:hypothetical protein VTJ49DRAFT_6990 [Mycothermus thermophilus]|uniref:HhH-GPD domain-containing protein n=1 Tax=Humicola insolens TaxID=85995 RepID=A0ABR3VI09_HUMIN
MLRPAPSFNHNNSTADDLLYGFETCDDEETKEFLSSLIASGSVPRTELNMLREISLARGVEEWDMLFDCASALRERSGGTLKRDDEGDAPVERSLVPYLQAVLEGRSRCCGCGVTTSLDGHHHHQVTAGEQARRGAEVLKRRGRRKGVSPFWGESDDEKKDIALRLRGRPYSQVLRYQPIEDTGEANGAVQGTVASGDGNPTTPSASVEFLPTTEESILWGATEEQPTADPSSPSPPPAPPIPRTQPAKPSGSKSPFFSTPKPTRRRKTPTTNPTPPSTQTKKKSRPPRGLISSLPIPPLSSPNFGLIQEELASDPFSLLVAVTFLIKTRGRAAIPVFRELMSRWPGPAELAAADPEEVTALIRPLGLSAVRCNVIQRYARTWLERPPSREVRYGVKNYPRPGDGREVRAGQEFGPENEGVDALGGVDAVTDARERGIGCAWEIGHLTQGPYALDSWRIFCRDVLLGRSRHWTGRGERPEFQPEWMRVLPRDKELRACLRWMWMKEGWEWDPETGEREPLREELRRAVDEGRVGYDDNGNLVILEVTTTSSE